MPLSLGDLRRITAAPRNLRGYPRSAAAPRASKSFTKRSRFPRSLRSSLKASPCPAPRKPTTKAPSRPEFPRPPLEPCHGPSPEVLHQSTEPPRDLQAHHRHAVPSRASTSSRKCGAIAKSPSPPELQNSPECHRVWNSAGATGAQSRPESQSPSPERLRVTRHQRLPTDCRLTQTLQAALRPETSQASMGRRRTLNRPSQERCRPGSAVVALEARRARSIAVFRHLRGQPRHSIGPDPRSASQSSDAFTGASAPPEPQRPS
jgi:hypothetical protein